MGVISTKSRQLFEDDGAAVAIEYALIAALIAVTAIAGMAIFGDALMNLFNYSSDTAGSAIEGAGSTI